MKRAALLFGFLGVLLSASAQTMQEWQDPQVNEVNRMDDHAAFLPEEAQLINLAGAWRFRWDEHATGRPADFYKKDYDDSRWDTMPVPGLWELYGYGTPSYVGQDFGWKPYEGLSWKRPPIVPEQNNHVGSYRRIISVPAEWKGQLVRIHLGSVTSCVYLWVNGRFVGYSEDSKAACEFDLTRHLRYGSDNLIAMQVFRWCDGSYLEDQDFFRYCGIARDCYLLARPKTHLEDLRLTATLDDNYCDRSLTFRLKPTAIK